MLKTKYARYALKLTPLSKEEATEYADTIVEIVGVPEVLTEGKGIEGCKAMALDALSLLVTDCAARREPFPAPVDGGDCWLDIPPTMQLKFLLAEAMVARNWRQADLSKALGVTRTVASRIVDCQTNTDFGRMVDALDKLGIDLEVGTARSAKSATDSPSINHRPASNPRIP